MSTVQLETQFLINVMASENLRFQRTEKLTDPVCAGRILASRCEEGGKIRVL